MLTLNIQHGELWDERTEEFIPAIKESILLEHSLVAISKWEQKWKKPFLKPDYKMSIDELIDYIKCMTLNKVNPIVYNHLTEKDILAIADYINDSATATWFNEDGNTHARGSEVTTSELIYYWMTAYNIPVSFQYWHLNRLLTLIRICNIKNQPPKKHSKNELLARHNDINRQRRAAMAKKRGR